MKNKYILILDNLAAILFLALSLLSILLLFKAYSDQLLLSFIGLLLLTIAYSPLVKKGFFTRILLTLLTLIVL